MREARWDIQDAAVRRREGRADPGAKGGRGAPNIDCDIKHISCHDPDQLSLGVSAFLVVEAAQDTAS